jgi:ferredoxin, 2Fe-2S
MNIVVTLPGGETVDVNANPGSSVMDSIRAAGLPIRAECGGAMACATCHVAVDPQWFDKVGAAGDEESDLLEDSDYSRDNSRLACQIIAKNELDGLRVTLQLDAFEG